MSHSLIRKLFSRKQTYVEKLVQDEKDPALVFLFTARRVMPEDGESFDIWTAWLFDLRTFTFTKGISQAGENFSIKSPFAQRALDDLRQKSLQNLKWKTPKEEFESEEEEELAMAEVERSKVEMTDVGAMVSDTEELPDMPKDGLAFMHKVKFNRNFFFLKVFRKGVQIAEHKFIGDGNYTRHSFRTYNPERIVFTYRKFMMGDIIDGMAVCVLDASTGQVLYDDFIL